MQAHAADERQRRSSDGAREREARIDDRREGDEADRQNEDENVRVNCTTSPPFAFPLSLPLACCP